MDDPANAEDEVVPVEVVPVKVVAVKVVAVKVVAVEEKFDCHLCADCSMSLVQRTSSPSGKDVCLEVRYLINFSLIMLIEYFMPVI